MKRTLADIVIKVNKQTQEIGELSQAKTKLIPALHPLALKILENEILDRKISIDELMSILRETSVDI
jgi:hypothetical protein